MLIYLLMLLAEPPNAALRDEVNREGRSTVHYKSPVWSAKPSKALDAADAIPVGVKYAGLIVGADGQTKWTVAWDAGTSTASFDFASDGRYPAKQRFVLGAKPVEIPVVIDRQPRTLLARLRAGEPVFAIRGFAEGTVAIGGKSYRYFLMDGDGDGCFHHAGEDRIGIDLDGDGKIDPLTEIFPVGVAVDIAGVKYLLKPNAAGDRIEVFRRPDATGQIEFSLARAVKALPTNVKLSLVSEWGEWIPLEAVGKIETLPVGQYRIERLEFQLAAEKYETWSYAFYNPSSKLSVIVEEKGQAKYELLPELKLQMTLDSKGRTDSAMVAPQVVASNGLTMSTCNKETPSRSYGNGVEAEILLNESGSKPVSTAKTGFF